MSVLTIPAPPTVKQLIGTINPHVVAEMGVEQVMTSTPADLGLDEFDTIELLAGIGELFKVVNLPYIPCEEATVATIVRLFVAQAVNESIR